MSKKPFRFHVNESDLLCKNQCGFYGNTAWKGYCSVCYKSLSNRQQFASRQASHKQIAAAKPVVHHSLKSEQSYAKFPDKRRQQSKTNPVKSLFSKSSKKEKPDPDKEFLQPVPKAKKMNEFSAFLERLSRPIYEDISKRVQTFLGKFKSLHSSSTVEMWSDSVQDFYQMISDHINSDPMYQSLEEAAVDQLLDRLEMYLMSRLYNAVFCPGNSQDEQQDLNLQKRIKSLHWVTIQQLEANVNDQDLGVRSALDKSISDIIEMDTRRSPKDKLTCIVDCSRKIFDALQLSNIRSAEATASPLFVASADDFLPVFIYIILKASPPRLKSNINYITRFACPSRLNSGEGGYFFTNMCCVVEFIEKLNAESLNLSEEEFNIYMSGEATPEGVNTVYMCDGLRLIHENSEMIKKLKKRQEKCQSNVEELDQRLSEFRKQFDEQINELVTKAPLAIKPRRRQASIDTNSDIPSSLPSPIKPQQMD